MRTRRRVTDDSGYFRAIHLPPSTYTVTVTAAGFQTFNSPEVIVQVGLLTDLSPKMPVGAQPRPSKCSASPRHQHHLSGLADLITQRVLQDLPMNNYRWSAYALLTPGVVSDSSGFGLLSFRGQSTLLNNVTIDGADDNQATSPKSAAAPAPDTRPPRPPSRSSRSTPRTTPLSTAVPLAASSTPSPRAAAISSTANSTSPIATLNGRGGCHHSPERAADARRTLCLAALQAHRRPQAVRRRDRRPHLQDKLFFFFAGDGFQRNFPAVAVASNPAASLRFRFHTPGRQNLRPNIALAHPLPQCHRRRSLHVTDELGLPTYTAASTDYSNGITGLNTMLGTVPRRATRPSSSPRSIGRSTPEPRLIRGQSSPLVFPRRYSDRRHRRHRHQQLRQRLRPRHLRHRQAGYRHHEQPHQRGPLPVRARLRV